jgi:hypothetical protein
MSMKKMAAVKRRKDAPPDDLDDEPDGLSGAIPLGRRDVPHHEKLRLVAAGEDAFGAFPQSSMANHLIDEFRAGHKGLGPGEEWVAWIVDPDYHPDRPLRFMVGFSAAVPSSVLDTIEEIFRTLRLRPVRLEATPDRAGLVPLLWLGAEGLELLKMI